MAHKKMGQASFVEAFLRPDVEANRRLERIGRMIDWASLAALVKPVRSGAWGRPSYPPLSMLKALLLQRWYSLSDEGLEEALASAVVPAVLWVRPRRRDGRRQNHLPLSAGTGRCRVAGAPIRGVGTGSWRRKGCSLGAAR